MITENDIYDYVYTKVNTAFPDAYIASKFEPIPAAFPAVFVREIGNFSNQQNVSLGGSQGVITSTFEVQICSNKVDSPKSEVRAIEDAVDAAFVSLRYIITGKNILEDGDNGIYRKRLTYRRIWGDAETVPTA